MNEKKYTQFVFNSLQHLLNSDQKVSVGSICQNAHISRSTFYRLFNNKDDAILNYYCTIIRCDATEQSHSLSTIIHIMYKNKDILKKNINLAIEGIKIELANKEYIISHLKGSKIGSSIEIVKLKHVSITSALVTWLKSDCKLDEEQFIMFISSLSKI